MNRCSVETNGYIPDKFKLGSPTPGEENDCNGAHFILEDHLLEISTGLQRAGHTLEDSEINEAIEFEENTAQCSSSQTSSLYLSSRIETINQEISRKMDESRSDTCISLDVDPDIAQITSELTIENQRKRKISDSTDYSQEYDWETTKYFE